MLETLAQFFASTSRNNIPENKELYISTEVRDVFVDNFKLILK